MLRCSKCFWFYNTRCNCFQLQIFNTYYLINIKIFILYLEELYNIIQSLCKDLPENLMFKYYAVKSKQAKEVCYKQYFSELLLPLAPNILYSDTCKNWQQIRKTWLLEQISKFIFCQRV